LAGEAQHTTSEGNEPHRLVHEVTKPVIQEVREIITPYRRVIQEIKPVQEEIQTIIAKGEPRNNMQSADFGSGSGYGSGLGSGIKGSGLSGQYAAAASNQPSSSITRASSSLSKSSGSSSSPSSGAVSYFNDGLSGVSFAQASLPSSSSSVSSNSGTKSSPVSQSTGGSSIRIIEGGNSRSSGMSTINAYKSRA
ncbi:DFP2-like protein, partial [Euroglyphus maynei]